MRDVSARDLYYLAAVPSLPACFAPFWSVLCLPAARHCTFLFRFVYGFKTVGPPPLGVEIVFIY